MKVVLINSWYKQYSTGKLVQAFHEHLIQQGHDVISFYGHGNESTSDNVIKITSNKELYIHAALCRITGYEGYFSNKATKKLIDKIEKYHPYVVYLFNLHAYYLNEYLLLSYLKKKHIHVVYMLFDEYPYLGRCCFAGNCKKFQTKCENCSKVKEYPGSMLFDRSTALFNRKRAAFENWDELTLAGVEFLRTQAQKSVIAKNIRFETLDMGVELITIYYPRNAEILRHKLNIPKKNKIIVTVGSYSDDRKGIKKLVEIAKICRNENMTFINIGFDGDKNELPDNFLGIAYVSNQNELAMYYSLADIYAITSSGEAISLTCMEALGCGSKLIGFNISGTPYAASEEFGSFVEYDDMNTFANTLISSEKKSDVSILACRNYALSRYKISDFTKNLEKIATKRSILK